MERMNILLVDDRPENLLALESLLKAPGIVFHRARSGVEALELLLVHEFALAILDVQMPEMDGFELAEMMRGPKQTRSVPIIFVTAGSQDRLSTFRGYETGAVDFLYKPLDPHVVKSKVHVFLELARQRRLIQDQLRETQLLLQERDQALLDAREALRTRDEFMSIASHELKTPLTSMHLQLQMMGRLLRKGLESQPDVNLFSERMTRSLEVCERQSGKLNSLLNELLDLTRVRLGKLELQKMRVDLIQSVREVVERFKYETEQKGITIGIDAPEQLIGRWDPTRIDQILNNLLSNSIKYGNSKPVQIRIQLESDSGAAIIEVRDQGIGIPEDMQVKIFERFERAVSGTTISGLGLGLYITRQIVEAHGGTVSVESGKGDGSVFRVRIPLNHEELSLVTAG